MSLICHISVYGLLDLMTLNIQRGPKEVHCAISNEPKMIIVRYPEVSQGGGGLKNVKWLFSVEISHFARRKSATKFLCVKTVSSTIVGHSLPYQCKNYWWGTSPSTGNYGPNCPRWSEIVDFRSIFACSASAVTSSEKG